MAIGALQLPSIGDVRFGVQFGASGTEYTGTMTLPPSGNVTSDISYGTGGTQFDGTYIVAPSGSVELNIQYGAGGTQYIGTYTGTADYPVIGDVRNGIAFNSGANIGNMTLPPSGNVESTVTYGTLGTQFDGQLVVPVENNVRYGATYGDLSSRTGTYVASSQTITGTTGIQSYVTLLSGIVDGLKEDSRMSAVNDEFIYYGPEGNIPQFPAITVELTAGQEPWKTFPAGKDSEAMFTVRIYDEGYDYGTALQSVEELSKNVNHTLNARTGFSGLVYQADIINKRFAMFDFDNMPVFGCEMELLTKTRFSRAS